MGMLGNDQCGMGILGCWCLGWGGGRNPCMAVDRRARRGPTPKRGADGTERQCYGCGMGRIRLVVVVVVSAALFLL